MALEKAWNSGRFWGSYPVARTGGQGEVRTAGGAHIWEIHSNQGLPNCPSSAKGLTVDDRTTVRSTCDGIRKPEAGFPDHWACEVPKPSGRDTVFPHLLWAKPFDQWRFVPKTVRQWDSQGPGWINRDQGQRTSQSVTTQNGGFPWFAIAQAHLSGRPRYDSGRGRVIKGILMLMHACCKH